MDPTPIPCHHPPAEICGEPAVGTGGFLAAGRPPLWFTPRHILEIIRPEEQSACFLVNPPFGRPSPASS